MATAPSPNGPNLAFSDSFKGSVAASLTTAHALYNGGFPTSGLTTLSALITAVNSQPTNAGSGALAGHQDAVGVIPFAWYAGNTTTPGSSGVTNMTQQAAAALLYGGTTGGGIPLSYLTGNASDATNYAFLVGRNEDSGTRVGAFAEAQQGFAPGVKQWELTFSGTSTTGSLTTNSGNNTTGLNTGGIAATVSGATLFPSTVRLYTEPNVGWNTTGHSGYAAGGDVANVLLAVNNSPSTLNLNGTGSESDYFFGYLGFADGYGLTNPNISTNNSALELNYNGVTPSVAAIENGNYTFWGYEHIYYLTGTQANTIGANKTDADNIADSIFQTYADTNTNGTQFEVQTPPSAGILYSDMKVNRAQEGALIQ